MKNIQKLSDNELLKELEETIIKITAHNVTSEIYTNEINEDKELTNDKEKLKEEIMSRMEKNSSD